MNLFRGEIRNFCLEGPSCATNIFIKTTPPSSHTHTHTHAFLLYIHIYIHILFYLISYIFTHPTKKKLVFSIKIIFDGKIK